MIHLRTSRGSSRQRRLRRMWWDPKVERYLMTFDEERDARTNAEARADSAEARIRELEAELVVRNLCNDGSSSWRDYQASM